MAYWLMKTEPEEFCFADLERAGREPWNGVRSPAALKHMRMMQPDDMVFIYHTGKEREIVGIGRVVSTPYPDPAANDPCLMVVDVSPERPLRRPVTLSAIKADARFAEWELVRQPRLSVMPVSEVHWSILSAMGGS